MVTYVFMFIVGFILAWLGKSYIMDYLNLQEYRQTQAVMDYFNVKKNEFALFDEGVEDFYIVSLNSSEYRVKFSKHLPKKVVFAEELEGVEAGTRPIEMDD
ncbi:hypothetical protein [Enterococcus sp. LJL90]